MRERALSEAECYARCYGQTGLAVQVIPEERQPRLLLAELVRRVFEEHSDTLEPEAA